MIFLHVLPDRTFHNELFNNQDYDHNDMCDNHDVPSDSCDHQNHSHHESSLSISLHNGPSTNFAN